MINLARLSCVAVSWLALAAPAALGAGAGVAVNSRSMPDSCEFVYRLESDFEFLYQDNLPRDSKVTLVYAFEDGYGERGSWVGERDLPMESPNASEPVKWRASATEETMSTHLHHLYREMNFYFLVSAPGTDPSHPRRDPGDAGIYHHVDFSREFGDHCFTPGRPSTPFRARTVTLKRLARP